MIVRAAAPPATGPGTPPPVPPRIALTDRALEAGTWLPSNRRPPGLGTHALQLLLLPLAIVMVGLTTLTLWSLGQAIVVNAAR